jgi:hypothetical protein
MGNDTVVEPAGGMVLLTRRGSPATFGKIELHGTYSQFFVILSSNLLSVRRSTLSLKIIRNFGTLHAYVLGHSKRS